MNCFYLPVLFFSFAFRSVLVLYAERGLVQKGRTNLVLFNQLYWLVVLTFISLILTIDFLPNLLRGDYILQDMNKARACLLGEMTKFSSKKQTTRKAVGTALVMLLFSRVIYQKYQVSRYMRRLCPNGRMSCVGNFRRNLIDINMTFGWLLWWCFSSLICCISVDYGTNILSVQTQFYIWNTTEFVCYEGFHIALPFLLCLPSQGVERSNNAEFYVREPDYQPRRLKMPDSFYSTVKISVKYKGKGKQERTNLGGLQGQRLHPDKSKLIQMTQHMPPVEDCQNSGRFFYGLVL